MNKSRVRGWRTKYTCQLFKFNDNKFWQKQKLEIQKYKEKASFDENYIRNLRSQIDSRDWDLRRTLDGYMEASQAKDRLQQDVSDKKRALHKDRLRRFRVTDVMKGNHEFFVDVFSMTKLQESHNTMNNLMDKVRELRCYIYQMHDPKDFKDAESVHSGQLPHVPSESASFSSQDEQGGLLGCAEIMPLNIWDTQCTSGSVLASPLAYPSSS